jgi:SAM-dependent methyltransferase
MNEFQLNIFFEIHSNNLREGPGSFESTSRAYSHFSNLPIMPKILDIGCGPGQQSLDLARISSGKIISIDNHQSYLDTLNSKINLMNLADRISVMNMDMLNLEFNSLFDIIWSEGAIYIIGLEKGLKEWKHLLKPNGYIAVSHICWLKENQPKELIEFWNEAYPAITSVEENLRTFIKCGYEIIEHFTLPDSDWRENYYNPLKNKLKLMEVEYRNSPEALEVINIEKKEMDLFEKYSNYYGYEFFIAQIK